MELGKRLIKECRDVGVAVKFQIWKSNLYSEDAPIWQRFPNLKDFELAHEKARELKEYADKIGIDWFCSCFFPEAVNWCEELGVRRYKISHRRSHVDFNIMHRIAETGKPVIVSVTTFQDKRIIDIFRGSDLTLLYCVPLYPAPKEKVNLETMKMLKDKHGVKAGYSNHVVGEAGVETCKEAIRKGADVVEVHTMLEGYLKKSPDGICSLTIEELKEICEYSSMV